MLWFLTSAHSAKIHDPQRDDRVQLSFADTKSNNYLCASGRAEVINDRDRIAGLWNEAYREFFPKGPDDPNIRAQLDRAEFWDAPRQTDPWVAGIVAMSQESPPEAHGVVTFGSDR